MAEDLKWARLCGGHYDTQSRLADDNKQTFDQVMMLRLVLMPVPCFAGVCVRSYVRYVRPDLCYDNVSSYLYSVDTSQNFRAPRSAIPEHWCDGSDATDRHRGRALVFLT